MGLTSLQVCMDSSYWLQEAESSGNTQPLPPGTAAAAAAALMDGGRRLRPPQDQPLKCPRCESTHTKFCYYNNYSLSQPRYFCKTCRRYWTKGGTLRNIPVGGGCRKTKKPSSSGAAKKPSNASFSSSSADLTAPRSRQNYQNAPLGLPHFAAGMVAGSYAEHGGGFLESKYGGVLPQNPRPIDFLDSKFDLMVMNNDLSMVDPGTNVDHHIGFNHGSGFHGFNGGGAGIMDITTCQRLMLTTTYDHHHHNSSDYQSLTTMDVKPNQKLLSLDWQEEQVYSDAGKGSSGASYGGYINGLGASWNGLINGDGSSTKPNSLV